MGYHPTRNSWVRWSPASLTSKVRFHQSQKLLKEVTVMKRRNQLVVILLLGTMVALTLFERPEIGFGAEKFPSREVVIIVPFPAGSSVDLPSRILAEYLKNELRVPVVVENRPEAGAVAGVLAVYKAKPDGYTLLANLVPRSVQTEVIMKAPYKMLEMSHLAGYSKQEMYVVVNKDSAYKTLKDLVEASKKKSLNCGISGMGSLAHLCAAVLQKRVGIEMELVPFKQSGAQALMAMLGGDTQLTVIDDLNLTTQKAKVRGLGVFAEKRAERFPDVPAMKELGYDVPIGFSMVGVSAPPNLPGEISKVLEEALAKSLKNPEFISRIEKMGPTVTYMSGKEFRELNAYFYKLLGEYKEIFAEKN